MANIQANHATLVRWVLDRSAQEPVQKRVPLLRGLAEVCGNPALTEQLNNQADQLEKADRCCAELALDIQPRNQGGIHEVRK